MYDSDFKATTVFEYLNSGKNFEEIAKKYSIKKRLLISWEKQFYSKPAFRKETLGGRQLVHMLHIGKTGGTALKEAIHHSPMSEKYFICFRGHGTKLKQIPRGDKVVFFLRDPVDRFISGFYSRRRQGMPKYFSEWSNCEKLAFKQFDTPNDLGRALLSDDELIRFSAECAMSSITHVKSSFLDWFENIEYFEKRISDILFVGYQETLDENFETLKSITGLKKSIALPTDPIKAHISNDNGEKSLDEDVIKYLREWYRKDYAFLEYCKRELTF